MRRQASSGSAGKVRCDWRRRFVGLCADAVSVGDERGVIVCGDVIITCGGEGDRIYGMHTGYRARASCTESSRWQGYPQQRAAKTVSGWIGSQRVCVGQQ
eukprot:IDg16525t1